MAWLKDAVVGPYRFKGTVSCFAARASARAQAREIPRLQATEHDKGIPACILAHVVDLRKRGPL
jgi:hypothetical protein